MKKRNPFAVLALSIITIGIYDIYWLVKTKAELNKETSHKTPSIWILFGPLIIVLIGYILLFAGLVNSAPPASSSFTYSSGNLVNSAPPASNSSTYSSSNLLNSNPPASNSSIYSSSSTTSSHLSVIGIVGLIVIVIGAMIGVVVSFIWFFKFSKAINEYTNGKMSTAVAFLTLWLIHFIGLALVQDAFNDTIDAQPEVSQSYPNPATTPYPSPPIPSSNAPIQNAINMPTISVSPTAPSPGTQSVLPSSRLPLQESSTAIASSSSPQTLADPIGSGQPIKVVPPQPPESNQTLSPPPPTATVG